MWSSIIVSITILHQTVAYLIRLFSEFWHLSRQRADSMAQQYLHRHGRHSKNEIRTGLGVKFGNHRSRSAITQIQKINWERNCWRRIWCCHCGMLIPPLCLTELICIWSIGFDIKQRATDFTGKGFTSVLSSRTLSLHHKIIRSRLVSGRG